MKIEIKSWYDGKILFEGEFGSLKLSVEAAVKSGASLDGANLDGASLDRASLVGASLYRANLVGASLYRANLVGANLVRASLDGATKLTMTTRLPTGETWKEYLDEVVPALIQAGGKSVSEKAWSCHEWTNCPMSEAFGIKHEKDVPLLFHPRARQFVQFFDAGLIPMPKCVKPASGDKGEGQ